MEYTLTIQELLQRPIIRNDNSFEFLCKMTDEEISKWESEVMQILKEKNVPEIYPDYNAAYIAKIIDRQILYDLFKLGNETI
jgi:hypothetical protein